MSVVARPFIGLIVALGIVPSAAAVTADDGQRAYNSGRFDDSLGIWAQLAKQGDAAAEFGLGLMYDLGNGVPEDKANAFTWYLAAARAGLPAAEFNVAVMYDNGLGVTRDRARAALWYAKAGLHGNGRAQFDLGQLYETGDGVPRNPAAAKAWYHQAAAAGLSAATEKLKAMRSVGSQNQQSSAPLVKVVSESPQRDATITGNADTVAVELVWDAPAEPEPVRYSVRVWRIDASSMSVASNTTVDQTAALVTLPNKPGFYAWSVDAVEQHSERFATGDWNWFSIKARSQSNPRTADAGSDNR